MEKTNLHYSTKNIPTASINNYKAQLINKIEAVIRRMRWKAIFFQANDDEEKNEDQQPETYGLKSRITPNPVPEMANFEKDLIGLVQKLKFKRNTNDFQNRMRQDVQQIKRSDKLYVPADKTTNMYKVDKEEYGRILQNSVTATYKKADDNIKNTIDYSGRKILKDNPIIQRMNVNAENSCFITMKDHKENFANNPTTRLINPAKNELGRISKVILEKITTQVRTKLNLNQWKNTKSVIDWFSKIEDKSNHVFMMFDVKDFYPSITESLLKNAIIFAEKNVKISKKDKEIIFHSRKSLLFNKKESWIKKGDKLFDVTMGAFDGAEVCELVGCFLLSLIPEKYKKENIGLYRDDGLSVFKNVSGPESERIKKDFQALFRKHKLELVIECNKKIVNYLDVTLDLNTGTYRPYHKPNNEVNYVHVKSNHPPNIIKQIPFSIQNRLSNLSANEEIFNQSTPFYAEALRRSGYDHHFEYTPDAPRPRRNRSRKIIWFNPPFNNNVKTNVGRCFLNMIQKHFPQGHKLHKIFNKNTVKVSYSCMPNIKSIINAHNKKVLSPQQQPDERTCNCIRKERCPMSQNCLVSNIVYEATLTSSLPGYGEKKYIGLCESTFKTRYSAHKTSFNLERYRNNTTLSTEVWRIKDGGGIPSIVWRVIRKSKAFTPESGRCALCEAEKFEIINYPGSNLLNKRSEIMGKCRHQRKFELELCSKEKN